MILEPDIHSKNKMRKSLQKINIFFAEGRFFWRMEVRSADAHVTKL